ncbi:formamidopyrimidine/5-formyluracil/5-hydroxymethy luracil DNA glycosylase [Erysipelotrichaceae bacterium]|nr:formamidopyrimidine/5-formyluracil/5-hydroxymethy luracil DNA glycosylase [Erysipelotrichaceae bacterium]
MPELPEVETVVRQLDERLKGQKITAMTIFYPKMVKTDNTIFSESIIGQKISGVERFGKYILICLENKKVIRIHLRMEGKFYIVDTLVDESLEKHTHIIFHLDDGKYIKYHDVRKFGTMECIDYHDNWHTESKFATLGYEPWEKLCTPAFIFGRLQKSITPIKTFLLSQKTLVGLGNIYVDEVLFRAKIHPAQIAATLKESDAKMIKKQSEIVLRKAITLGGTTIRTYHNTFGIDGLFQNELQVHLQKGKGCPICGTEIIKEKLAGRGTYYCPSCQTIK